MTFVVVWLLCGIGAAIIADNKGQSGCAGFMLGVLLGPFGILLALVISRDEKAIERKALKSGDMKRCPQCAELIRAEAVRCRYCGAETPPPIVYQNSPLAKKLRPK